MNQVALFYNPFLPELKISVNGNRISKYSPIMSFRHKRLSEWADSVMDLLYREVNSEFEITCISSDFACDVLSSVAEGSRYCTGFSARPLPNTANVYERLYKLELFGADEDESIIIPIVNASENDGMTDAVFEVIEDEGIFEDVSAFGITWTDCPLTTVEIKPYGEREELPYSVPAVIALCESEDDYIKQCNDAPVYALVMGTETKFIKKQRGVLYFSVDPDGMGTLLLHIIEEEALCPLLSRLSYDFPEEAKDFLTEHEREELECVCEASPLCRVTLPSVCDVGRDVHLNVQVFPADSTAEIRTVSDSPSVIAANALTLTPRAAGEAEVSVFIGDDPYPAATEIIRVRQRTLISEISLFPSVLYMPSGGEEKLNVTVHPDGAENTDEIRWRCDDTSVAEVDGITGVISAVSCGRCGITAYTPETERKISLEVRPDIEDIICSCSVIEVAAGEQKDWRYRTVPENAYGIEFIRAVSSDRSVAEYCDGYILGKSVGECKIYIKNQSGSISRELRVTVKKNKKFW